MRTAMLYFLLLLGCSSHSSPIPLSDDTYTSPPSIGRTLLQAKKPCPVNFESMNYTVITSRCRPPHYPANLCCQAFKEFACPYSSELNDLSNDCSLVMFSYINLYGKYPLGMFSSLCHDDDVGLVCDSVPPGPATGVAADQSNTGPIFGNPYLQLVISTGFQVLLFWWVLK